MNLYGRRRMMQKPRDAYIKNGLVLWMDGINKGNVAGSWVDQISGHVFEGQNNPTFGTDYVGTSAVDDSYFVNETFSTPNSLNGTIEICISDFTLSANSQIIYMGNQSLNLAFGLYGLRSYVWTVGHPSRSTYDSDGIMKTLSVNYDMAYGNGERLQANGATYWGGSDGKAYIGKRLTGDGYAGKIHSIRIYNRKLTQSEILHNQHVDNIRFNLGLAI